MLSQKEISRYQRHIQLSEIGVIGQEKIKHSSVLIIGAGGLGCPILEYLTAVGVGTIGIVDFDTIDESNLQRQTLYSTNDIGKYKVDIAVQKLSRQNPFTKYITYCNELTNKNALDILSKYEIIIDGTDNLSSRYIINDACTLLNKPLIYGAIHKFEGQVTVFNYSTQSQPEKYNYYDLFPENPELSQVPNCSENGVIGVLPGIIGILQATEAIKIILGIGNILAGELLVMNVINLEFYIFKITKNQNKKEITEKEFKNFDYKYFCGESTKNVVKEISCDELKNELKNNRENIQLIDIREKNEQPIIEELIETKIPLVEIIERINEIKTTKKIILICKSGVRSKLAIQMLQKKINSENLFSLKGGINEWLK